MPYEFEVQPKDGYIRLTASGVLESDSDLMVLSQSLEKEALRFHCRRLLIDERKAVKKVTPHDFITFSDFKMNGPRSWLRMAIVYSPENVSRFRWIETVLQNRSVAYRQFSSTEEAEQWLVSPIYARN